MHVVVLGGTKFVGRHIVAELLSHGHRVTLFTRGQTAPDLFPEAEHLIGDRLGDVSALYERTYDAVVDVSAYVPRAVHTVAEALSGDPFYLFISTISVYDDPPAGSDETASINQLDDPTTEVITAETYGGLKVLCENEVRARYSRHVILRPGLIAGPYDPTDRFTYWAWRLNRPGPVPIPDRKSQPIQLIDARDLASFAVKALEDGLQGEYNCAGPPSTMGAVINACGGSPTWLPAATFTEANLEPWANLPLFTNFDDSGQGMMQISSDKALKAGLTYRPFEETAIDTIAWSKDMTSMKVGLTSEQEKTVLGLD